MLDEAVMDADANDPPSSDPNNTANTGTGTGTDNPSTGTTNPSTGTTNPSTGTTNPSTGTGDANSAMIDPVLAPLLAIDTGPAQELARAGLIMGTAHPDDLPEGDSYLTVRRTFCFIDLTGFTAYTRERGPHEAVMLLTKFRRVTRNVAAKRGVRVAKWLGDGAMLVCTQAAPVVALGAHLMNNFSTGEVVLRVGAATGEALLFEGDDYIGEPVNLAAKLCASARGGEMLAVVDEVDLPDWVMYQANKTVDIRGVGRIGGVSQLQPARFAARAAGETDDGRPAEGYDG